MECISCIVCVIFRWVWINFGLLGWNWVLQLCIGHCIKWSRCVVFVVDLVVRRVGSVIGLFDLDGVSFWLILIFCRFCVCI